MTLAQWSGVRTKSIASTIRALSLTLAIAILGGVAGLEGCALRAGTGLRSEIPFEPDGAWICSARGGTIAELQLRVRAAYPIYHGDSVAVLFTRPTTLETLERGVLLAESIDVIKHESYPGCASYVRYASGWLRVKRFADGDRLVISGYVQGDESCFADGLRLEHEVKLDEQANCTYAPE